MQKNYDALFEAQNEFAPDNSYHQDEKVVLYQYKWCEYVNFTTHWAPQRTDQTLAISLWQLHSRKISFAVLVWGDVTITVLNGIGRWQRKLQKFDDFWILDTCLYHKR